MSEKCKKIIKELLDRREISLLLLLAVLLVPITLRSPSFLSASNISLIFNDMAILVIVSIGQFFVILSNGIDLSVGSIIAFTGMACGMLNESHPAFPAWMLLFVGLGLGLLMGCINGALVSFGKIPPMLATLGTMSIYRGLTFVMSKGTWVTAHEMSTNKYFRCFFFDLDCGNYCRNYVLHNKLYAKGPGNLCYRWQSSSCQICWCQ